MAETNFLEGSEEWQLFMDYWGLCQKYWEAEDNDGYWYSLVDDADRFQKKYGTDFAMALARALIDTRKK